MIKDDNTLVNLIKEQNELNIKITHYLGCKALKTVLVQHTVSRLILIGDS